MTLAFQFIFETWLKMYYKKKDQKKYRKDNFQLWQKPPEYLYQCDGISSLQKLLNRLHCEIMQFIFCIIIFFFFCWMHSVLIFIMITIRIHQLCLWIQWVNASSNKRLRSVFNQRYKPEWKNGDYDHDGKKPKDLSRISELFIQLEWS